MNLIFRRRFEYRRKQFRYAEIDRIGCGAGVAQALEYFVDERAGGTRISGTNQRAKTPRILLGKEETGVLVVGAFLGAELVDHMVVIKEV